MANEALMAFGTQVTAISGTATRAAGAFSTSGEATAQTSQTYPLFDASLSCSYTTAPTEGDLVHLYRRDIDIDGTNDATIPEAGYEHHYLGSFPVKDVTSQQYISLKDCPASEDYELYIENDADQTMDSDYVLKITPKTFGN